MGGRKTDYPSFSFKYDCCRRQRLQEVVVTNLDSDLVKIFLKLKRPGREELVKYS